MISPGDRFKYLHIVLLSRDDALKALVNVSKRLFPVLAI